MAKTSKVNIQIAIRGKGVSRLSHDALVELTQGVVDGNEPPDGIEVDIQLWRQGRSIDWESSKGLRELIRGQLHGFPFSVRGD
jgi:hypothetical protein